MKEELVKFLIAFFGPTLKLTQEKIDGLFEGDKLKTDAVASLLQLDATRITDLTKQLKDAAITENDKSYSKGKGEALAKLETDLRESYGITSKSTGLDLVKEVVTAQLEKSGKPGTITETDVLKHPLYLSLQEKLKVETEKIQTDWDTKWKARDQEDKQRGMISKVKEHAEKLWDASKPVVSTDAAKAAAQKKLFIDNYVATNKVIEENGKFIPLGIDGKPKTDQHGHLVSIDDDFKGTLSGTYDLQQSDPKGTPPPPGGGNNPPPPIGERAYLKLGLKVPANEQEYMATIDKISKLPGIAEADRVKAQTDITEDWNKAAAPAV